MKVVVSDASPITNLLQIGQVELLRELYGEVIIPRGVERELAVAHNQIPPFIVVRDVHAVPPSVRRSTIELDAGEQEAIALAKELGILAQGLLGVLLEAKAAGLIAQVGPVLAELRTTAGFYLAPAIIAEVLRLAGESG